MKTTEHSQSATFTVTADSPQELAQLVRRIATALEGREEGSATAMSPSELEHWTAQTARSASPSFRWDPLLVDDLWSRIDKTGARHALEFLAGRGGSVPVEELGRELVKEPGPALAGTLSPIGRAVTAMQAQPPYQRVRGTYRVDPWFARAFRDFKRSQDPGSAAE